MKRKTQISKIDIDMIKQISQSIAMLDLIIMKEWELRYFSYNKDWDRKEEMASMRDGCGNHYFILFNEHGMIIKGFDRSIESRMMTPEEIFKDVPCEFQSILNEPAFIVDETNFCVWSTYTDSKLKGTINYITKELPLTYILFGSWKDYRDWATEYYERELDSSVIKDIFLYRPISSKHIYKLNRETSIDEIKTEIGEIGYPYKV